jgi:hypothetical protein
LAKKQYDTGILFYNGGRAQKDAASLDCSKRFAESAAQKRFEPQELEKRSTTLY